MTGRMHVRQVCRAVAIRKHSLTIVVAFTVAVRQLKLSDHDDQGKLHESPTPFADPMQRWAFTLR